MVKSILSKLQPENIYLCITGSATEFIPKWFQYRKLIILKSIIFSTIWLKIVGKLKLGFLHGLLLYKIYPRLNMRNLNLFIEENQIDKIWIIGSRHTFQYAYNLINTTNTPIHLSIYDDLVGNMIPGEVAFIEPQFKSVIRSVESIDVISKYLLQHLRDKYGLARENVGIYWIGSISSPLEEYVVRQTPTRLVFAGNIWSRNEIIRFAEVVETLSNRGVAIELSIYSYWDYSDMFSKYNSVVYRGYVNDSDILSELQKYDFVYVPMSFEESYRTVSMTSLPSKIIGSMQAGVPIIAHGPEYATNVLFTYENHIGHTITSIDEEKIIVDLTRIMLSPANERLAMSVAQRNLYNSDYNSERNASVFVEKYLV